MPYIALRPLTIGDEVRDVGEEVPEAAGWKNVDAYVTHGWLQRVDPPPIVNSPPPGTAFIDVPAAPAEPPDQVARREAREREEAERTRTAARASRVGARVRPAPVKATDTEA